MPYRSDTDARRMRRAVLEYELAELRARVGILDGLREEMLSKERELAELRRHASCGDLPEERPGRWVALAGALSIGGTIAAGILGMPLWALQGVSCRHERVLVTTTSAKELRAAAILWRAERPANECPTPEALVRDRKIDPASKLTDAWDDPFVVVCDGDEVRAMSPGPDRRFGTDDDIWVPAAGSVAELDPH